LRHDQNDGSVDRKFEQSPLLDMATHSPKASHPLIRWIHPPRQERSQQAQDR